MKEASGESCAIKEMTHDESFEREVNAMNSIPEHVYPNFVVADHCRGMFCAFLIVQKPVAIN
jgi:hypothetical protein